MNKANLRPSVCSFAPHSLIVVSERPPNGIMDSTSHHRHHSHEAIFHVNGSLSASRTSVVSQSDVQSKPPDPPSTRVSANHGSSHLVWRSVGFSSRSGWTQRKQGSNRPPPQWSGDMLLSVLHLTGYRVWPVCSNPRLIVDIVYVWDVNKPWCLFTPLAVYTCSENGMTLYV